MSWLKPNFPSGPIIEHIVTVENAAGDRLVTMATSSHTFGRLVPDTSYTVTVEARNAEGTSPGAAQNVTTLPAVNGMLNRFDVYLYLCPNLIKRVVFFTYKCPDWGAMISQWGTVVSMRAEAYPNWDSIPFTCLSGKYSLQVSAEKEEKIPVVAAVLLC